MFDALKKSMIDAIEEGQLKLGYRDETIRLYYPLESLCALTGKKLDAAQMMRELEAFFTKDEAELGKIEISRRGDRFWPSGRRARRGCMRTRIQTAFWRRLSRPLGGMVARWTSCWQFLTDTATGCMWRNCTTANLTGSSLLKTDSRTRTATASPTKAAT